MKFFKIKIGAEDENAGACKLTPNSDGGAVKDIADDSGVLSKLKKMTSAFHSQKNENKNLKIKKEIQKEKELQNKEIELRMEVQKGLKKIITREKFLEGQIEALDQALTPELIEQVRMGLILLKHTPVHSNTRAALEKKYNPCITQFCSLRKIKKEYEEELRGLREGKIKTEGEESIRMEDIKQTDAQRKPSITGKRRR